MKLFEVFVGLRRGPVVGLFVDHVTVDVVYSKNGDVPVM